MIFRSYNSCVSGNISQQTASLAVTDHMLLHNVTSYSNMALIDWLQNLQIDETSINRVNIPFLFHEINNNA